MVKKTQKGVYSSNHSWEYQSVHTVKVPRGFQGINFGSKLLITGLVHPTRYHRSQVINTNVKYWKRNISTSDNGLPRKPNIFTRCSHFCNCFCIDIFFIFCFRLYGKLQRIRLARSKDTVLFCRQIEESTKTYWYFR